MGHGAKRGGANDRKKSCTQHFGKSLASCFVESSRPHGRILPARLASGARRRAVPVGNCEDAREEARIVGRD